MEREFRYNATLARMYIVPSAFLRHTKGNATKTKSIFYKIIFIFVNAQIAKTWCKKVLDVIISHANVATNFAIYVERNGMDMDMSVIFNSLK